MPTNLVASMLMLHRRGINEEDLEKKVKWLGTTLVRRGYTLATDGLPSQNTNKIGIQHLNEYLDRKRDIIEPKISEPIRYLPNWFILT